MTAIETLEAAITAELERLGEDRTNERPCACLCEAEPNLPYGWVRVYDDFDSAYGPAGEILELLRDAEPSEEDGHAHSESAVWTALAGLPEEEAPRRCADWPEELWDSEKIEEGSVNDEPTTIIVVATNAGIRYACGPHGVSTDALSEALQADALCRHRQQAIEAECRLARGPVQANEAGDTPGAED